MRQKKPSLGARRGVSELNERASPTRLDGEAWLMVLLLGTTCTTNIFHWETLLEFRANNFALDLGIV